MTRFTDKHILITGATGGIGRAGAHRLAREGARLTLTGTTPERLAALQAELPQARIISNDAGDPRAADELAATVAEDGTRLDGLWLNAGYADVAAVETVDAEFFDRMMNANVRGPVLQLAQLAAHLSEGASVVVTSSTATYEGAGPASVYAATKGALVAIVRGWADALADRDIRVNTLVPGPIATDFRQFMPEDAREQFEADVVSRVTLGRIGTADEAAAVALFLLSDESTYVTASQYAVDGGLTKR